MKISVEALSYLPNRSCPFMTVSFQDLMLRIHSNAFFSTGCHVIGLALFDFSAWKSIVLAKHDRMKKNRVTRPAVIYA